MKPPAKRYDTARAGRRPNYAVSLITKRRTVFVHRLVLWFIAKIKGNGGFIAGRPVAVERIRVLT